MFASAVAFISDSESQIEAVKKIARVDLLLAYTFQLGGKACEIRLIPTTEIGRAISEYVLHL